MISPALISSVLVLSLGFGSCVPWTVRPLTQESGSAAEAATTANPVSYVDSIWSSKLLPFISGSAVEARVLLNALVSSPQDTLTRYAHREAEGPPYFIVKGQGLVSGMDSRSPQGLLLVDIAPFDQRPDLSIQIGPVIRGTSLRDATGLVRFTDFVNQLQFADVGNEMNNRVWKTVLAKVDAATLKGRLVSFIGTLSAETNADPPLREMVPVLLTVEAPNR